MSRPHSNTLCEISYVTDPGAFYDKHSEELAATGADAFGQPVELFEPQVAERFGKAEFAQILRQDRQIIGFSLFDTIRSCHWRPTVH
jgi:hypothetical protein